MDTFSSALLRAYSEIPDQTTITMQFANQPDRPISYRQLVEGASAYSTLLEQRGIRPGEVVVLILQHGADLVFAYWGTVLHGAIPSIMPFLTEKLLPERYRADLASLVSIIQPAAIITYPEFEGEVQASLKTGCSVRQVLLTNETSAALTEPTHSTANMQFAGLQRKPDDIVLLQHSSGTTGLQKGVALSHRAVFNQLQVYSQTLGLNSQDVLVSWLPLYHDMGLIAGFLMPVLLRVPLVMMSPFDWVRAPQRLFQAVSHYRGTLTWLPNFAYNFCAQKIRDRQLEGVDLSSWRAVINCSEPVRWESHQAFAARFAPYGLNSSALASCYAMAENVFAVTQSPIGGPAVVDEIDRESFQVERVARPAVPGQPSIKMLSCGKPLSNVRVRILDAQGQELPERQVGEIALHSDCMLSGYYRRPEETAKAFLDGWYLTGDYGYVTGGEVFVSGRKKDLIIVGGKNIYPQDLEQLAMQVPGVHAGRVVAFGIYNEETGTEDVVLVAEVDSEEPDHREQIAEQIRQVITRGSAVALRHVHLVDSHWLVKTSSGKTARLANREKYLAEEVQL
jgi:fatty-acyl-CoA synthase